MSAEAILNLPPEGDSLPLARWMHSFRPDAILCGGAHPIRSWLVELGYSVPEEVGIVRLASMRPEEHCAHVDERWRDVGATAVEHLVGQIVRGERGVPRRPTLTLVRGEWVEDDTVRRAGVGDRASSR